MLKQFFSNKETIECGCDEAGRGCLAGPVVAAAVILPQGFSHPLLNDSKKLSDKQRRLLRPIIEQNAIAYCVGFVSNQEIDKINILQASFLAMNRAVEGLKQKPELLLIDGNRFNNKTDIAFECIVKGDSLYQSIAAASILAKTYRDDYMLNLHKEFPKYHWDKNMGYPTKQHRQAIIENGISPFHRKSFNLSFQTSLF
ncbi:MAG: ribonuclease HII [Bacteroidales bacterium]|nr:ribonuclease HII [Bacteroidales bacterium]MEE1226637.1 ribonuclease HII [Bacteroidales bacterium]